MNAALRWLSSLIAAAIDLVAGASIRLEDERVHLRRAAG